MSNVDEMPDLDINDPAIAELVGRLDDLEQQVEAKEQARAQRSKRKGKGAGQSVPRMTLEEQFVYDLTLTEVDVPGGRRRDAIADGYAKIFDLLMSRVGTELQEYVEANGFTLQLLMATMKVYYSKEGRIVRGEQPRSSKDAPDLPPPPPPVHATPDESTQDDGNDSDEAPAEAGAFDDIDLDAIGADVLGEFVLGDDDVDDDD